MGARRRAGRWVLVGVLGCAAAAAGDPPRTVNVLFMVADDLNVALGAYGMHATAVTPHLDRLASEGVRFNRAYANDPLCNPSRTSFLSGRRPATTGVYGNFTRPRETLGDVTMLPEYFAEHGFFTARVGKIAHRRYEDAVSWDVSENAVQRPHYLTTEALVELVDLYPTLADLAGLPPPDGLEGTSFRPVLEDPARPWKSAAFSEARREAHGSSIRTARYRYTEWAPLSGDGLVERELYDLETDPYEFDNLAADPRHRALRDHLADRLAAGWRAALPPN